MRENLNQNILYISGAGGLSNNCINISTLAAILVSSFGIKVVKHVSYSANKKCTSAQLLDELGISVSRSIAEIETDFEKHGVVFIEAMPELVLDNMCPLISQVDKTTRFIGLSDAKDAMKYIFELKSKNYKRAIIVCPFNPNYDEATVCGATQIFELKNGEITNYLINPKDYAIKEAEEIELTGATALYNANLSINILSNIITGAKLDTIVINAGIMLYCTGFAKDITKGIISAYMAIETGQASRKVEALRSRKIC